MQGNSFHYFWYTVSFGFAGVFEDEDTGDQSAQGRYKENIPFAPVASQFWYPVIANPFNCVDQVAKEDCTEASTQPHQKSGAKQDNLFGWPPAV
jgi:hypothetical protein